VGFTRETVARRLAASLLLGAAACAAGCGAKNLVSVNKPLPANTLTSFDVQKISGLNYTGAGESAMSGGGIRFNITNSALMSNVLVLTHCGGGGTSEFQLTADPFVVHMTLTLVETRNVEFDGEGHMHVGTRSGG
jgi:hypothetical protein